MSPQMPWPWRLLAVWMRRSKNAFVKVGSDTPEQPCLCHKPSEARSRAEYLMHHELVNQTARSWMKLFCRLTEAILHRKTPCTLLPAGSNSVLLLGKWLYRLMPHLNSILGVGLLCVSVDCGCSNPCVWLQWQPGIFGVYGRLHLSASHLFPIYIYLFRSRCMLNFWWPEPEAHSSTPSNPQCMFGTFKNLLMYIVNYSSASDTQTYCYLQVYLVSMLINCWSASNLVMVLNVCHFTRCGNCLSTMCRLWYNFWH